MPIVSTLIHEITFRPEAGLAQFLELNLDEQVEFLNHLPRHLARDLLDNLPDDRLLAILEKVDPDEATDLLQILPKHKRQHIIEKLSAELQETVTHLLEFDQQTAAGLMDVDYIQVDLSSSIADVAKKFRTHEKRTGRVPVVVATKDHKPQGFLPAHELGFARRSDKIAKFIQPLPTIDYNASHKEVEEFFRAHPHSKVGVTNDNKDVIGVIYSDDVLKLLQADEGSSLYGFAGVRAEEGVADTVKRKVKSRYKWLIINLATAFLAAFTVGLFEDTISKYVLLAVYMPIVAGMGGNAATQTLAVVVRGIALRQIELKNAYRTLKNEVGAGVINGLINGFIVAFIVLVKDHEPAIALILALAMVVNLLVAAFFGTLVPLVMSKLRKDPAASATIFITTATDVFGFLAFLGLASLILS